MKRILIVEDVEWNRDLLTQILEDQYEVLEATDGKQGLEKAKAEKPDLILMDMLLPEMNGMEVASAIRESEGIADVPIIAVTAQAMSGDREQALAAGCNDYVSKPIDEDVLLEKIAKILK
jgi:CheY-like chemotaxis protein